MKWTMQINEHCWSVVVQYFVRANTGSQTSIDYLLSLQALVLGFLVSRICWIFIRVLLGFVVLLSFVEVCCITVFFGACGGCLRYYRLIWMCGLFELFELNGRREIDSALFICFDSTNKSHIFYPNVCNIAITKTRLLNWIYSPEVGFI